ncbi:hypothetical protein ACSBR1_027475 [Camellia fascicularis]
MTTTASDNIPPPQKTATDHLSPPPVPIITLNSKRPKNPSSLSPSLPNNPAVPYPLSSFPHYASSSASPESPSLFSPSSALSPSPSFTVATPRTLSALSTLFPPPDAPSSLASLEFRLPSLLLIAHHCLYRLEQATGLAFRFVIGQLKDAKKMAELEKEVEQYKDFMLIDSTTYAVMLYPACRLAFFKAAFELFEADYYVKADDDIYLRPDRLATLLAKERSHSLTYIGCMKKGPVITDPKLKW